MKRWKRFQAGDRAFLIESEGASAADLRSLSSIIDDSGLVRAAIVGHSSLLVLVSPGVAAEDLDRLVRDDAEMIDRESRISPRVHEIPVDFSPVSAPDLEAFLDQTHSNRRRFLEDVRSLRLTARYLGFLAGFAYLEGIPGSWMLPRRSRARTKVLAGSFGIAGEMAGFYPVSSPGGWNLLGRTPRRLWDGDAETPNLISPGDEVRIIPIDEARFDDEPSELVDDRAEGTPVAEIVHPGQHSLIVGLPDFDRYRYGLAAGGAFDAELLEAANNAVGNRADAMAIECTIVGPRLRFSSDSVLSWFGARMDARVDGVPVTEPRQFAVNRGEMLEIGPLTSGLRGVLAIQGGIVDRGPRHKVSPTVLHSGDRLRRFEPVSSHARIQVIERGDRTVLRAMVGPHESEPRWLDAIEANTWIVTRDLDRVGVRLRAADAGVKLPAMLRSCGMQLGTVQWHPGGELVIMGPDHPITGGYLQPLTIMASERWKIAQLVPGDAMRFELVDR